MEAGTPGGRLDKIRSTFTDLMAQNASIAADITRLRARTEAHSQYGGGAHAHVPSVPPARSSSINALMSNLDAALGSAKSLSYGLSAVAQSPRGAAPPAAHGSSYADVNVSRSGGLMSFNQYMHASTPSLDAAHGQSDVARVSTRPSIVSPLSLASSHVASATTAATSHLEPFYAVRDRGGSAASSASSFISVAEASPSFAAAATSADLPSMRSVVETGAALELERVRRERAEETAAVLRAQLASTLHRMSSGATGSTATHTHTMPAVAPVVTHPAAAQRYRARATVRPLASGADSHNSSVTSTSTTQAAAAAAAVEARAEMAAAAAAAATAAVSSALLASSTRADDTTAGNSTIQSSSSPPPQQAPSSPVGTGANTAARAVKRRAVSASRPQGDAQARASTKEADAAAIALENSTLRERLRMMQRDLSRLEGIAADASSMRSLAEERATRITALTQRMTAMRLQVDDAETAARKAKAAAASAEQALSRTRSEAKLLQARVDALEAAPVRVTRAPDGSPTFTQRELGASQARLLACEEELAAMRAHTTALIDTLAQADDNIARLTAALKDCEAREGQLHRDLMEAQTSRAKAISDLTHQLSTCEGQLMELRANNEDAHTRVSVQAADAAVTEARLRDADDRATQLRVQAASAAAEVAALREQIMSLTRENVSMRAALARAHAHISTHAEGGDSNTTAGGMSSSLGSPLSVVPEEREEEATASRLPAPEAAASSPAVAAQLTTSAASRGQDTFISPVAALQYDSTRTSAAASPSRVPPLSTAVAPAPVATSFVVGTEASARSITPQRSSARARSVSYASASPRSAAGSFTYAPVVASLVAPRQRTTAPVRLANHRRVIAALTSVYCAGPHYAEKLRAMRRVCDDNTDKQVVIALVSTGARSFGTLCGLYGVVEDAAHALELKTKHNVTEEAGNILAERLYGTGPAIITPTMIHTLLKFDTAAREFKEIGASTTFTITCDAVALETMHVVVVPHNGGAGVSIRGRD